MGVVVILIGATLFLRISNPLIKLLEDHNTELELANKNLTQEIDERNRAENALRESEAKYRLLVENANDAIFILQDGQIKFFNQQALKIGKFLAVELDRTPFVDYIYHKDRKMVLDRHIRGLDHQDLSHTNAFRMVGNNNQTIWAELNSVKINWENSPATLIISAICSPRTDII